MICHDQMSSCDLCDRGDLNFFCQSCFAHTSVDLDHPMFASGVIVEDINRLRSFW